MLPSSSKRKVEGALPCGNPKRYSSAEVLQMNKNDKGKTSASTADEETESGQYIQSLLHNQLQKDITLKQQFSQHRNFSKSSSHAPSVSKLRGLHSVSDHEQLDEFDATVEYLRSCGLSNEEITFKLKETYSEKFQIEASTTGYGTDPDIDKRISEGIERKLQEKEETLSKPDTFNGGLELSRQALVLEKSVLERQNKESTLPAFLFQKQKLSCVHPDDPINHIEEIISDINPQPTRLPRRERRKIRKLNQKLLRHQQEYTDFKTKTESKNSYPQNEFCPVSSMPIEREKVLDASHNQSNRVEDTVNELPNEDCVSNNPREIVSQINGKDLKSPKLSDCTVKDNDNLKVRSKTSNVFTLRDFGSNVHFVSEEDIQSNRLSLEEILKMDKFQHYDPGLPTETMFVKNLASCVTEIDLVSLFGSFEQSDTTPISFRLLNGRMKGQAFITFPDTATCSKAISSVNGYKFAGKAIILSFGKKSNEGRQQ